MGLARQGEQRGERGGEAVTEPRCNLALVETNRGAIAWCMKHVIGVDHEQHQLRPVARELTPATEATPTGPLWFTSKEFTRPILFAPPHYF